MAKSNTMIVHFGIGESLSMIEGPKIGDIVRFLDNLPGDSLDCGFVIEGASYDPVQQSIFYKVRWFIDGKINYQYAIDIEKASE